MAKTPAASTEVVVNLAVAASGLSWVAEGGRHVVTLDIAIYCADSRERIIGESWKRATLKLTDDTYEAALRDGLPYVSPRGGQRNPEVRQGDCVRLWGRFAGIENEDAQVAVNDASTR